MPYYISPPPQSPLTRVITAIIAVFALVGAFMIGFAALIVVVVVGLVAGIALWLRVAWIKRRLRKEGIDLGVTMKNQANSGHVIDAEYTVISEAEDQSEK